MSNFINIGVLRPNGLYMTDIYVGDDGTIRTSNVGCIVHFTTMDLHVNISSAHEIFLKIDKGITLSECWTLISPFISYGSMTSFICKIKSDEYRKGEESIRSGLKDLLGFVTEDEAKDMIHEHHYNSRNE